MVERVDNSIRSAVELEETAQLPNSIQSPSQSKAIQDNLRKRQTDLREKFKEAVDELTGEELGIVHRGIQVGEGKVYYKQDSSVNFGDVEGVNAPTKGTRAQQVAKEANQVESIFQRPSIRKTSIFPVSKRSARRSSDEDRLYEDTREGSTSQWTVPDEPYADTLNDNNKSIGGGYANQKLDFSWLQLLLYNLRIMWKRYSSRNSDRIPFLRPQIKEIEGNFGVGIASFFVFARLVITVNIFVAVLWTCFVIVPVIIRYDTSDIVTVMYHDDEDDDIFYLTNLFDGRGPVADSWLFYGGYVRESFCESNTSCVTSTGACEYSSCSYRIDIAYMIMIFVSLFGPFFILSWSYSSSLSSSGSSNSASENTLMQFSVIILTSWDHSLVSSEAVGNLSKGITNTLKDRITEYENAEKKKIQTNKEKAGIILRRITAWMFAAFLVMLATGAIVLTIVYGPDIREVTEDGNVIVQTLGEYLELYGTSVLFVIINALVPNLMFLLLPFEKYDSGKTEFNVTITRVFLVRIFNLYALMAGWLIATEECELEESVVCAGTYYGQELYKVVILSIVATIFGQLILRFGYFYWFNKKKEFLVADAVLAVVYMQSVVWTGTAVCPFLPLIAAIGLLCLFFAYYFIVQYTCHPPIKRWSQSRQNSFFLFSLLAALVCVIVPVSITVQTDHVPLGSLIFSSEENETAVPGGSCSQSLYCGPFRNRTASFAILPDEASDSCGLLCELFYIIFSSAIGLPLIFCLMVALLQFSIRLRHANKKHTSLLRELEAERQKMRIMLTDYHELQFKLKQRHDVQEHRNTTNMASLGHDPSREPL